MFVGASLAAERGLHEASPALCSMPRSPLGTFGDWAGPSPRRPAKTARRALLGPPGGPRLGRSWLSCRRVKVRENQAVRPGQYQVVRDVDERTDAEILATVPSDPQAFLEIFERHFAVIHRYVTRQLGRDAEDASAEVFVRALRGASTFRPESDDARPWLYGIAAHVVRAELRRRYSARIESLDHVRVLQHDPGEEHRPLEAVGYLVEVQRAVESLPLDEREPLLMFAWLDLSYEEVAAALDVPIGTVRSRIARARRRLRQALGMDNEEVTWNAT